jgi:membrane associated rhomboid family serine protease
MGIYDRDYYEPQPTGIQLGGPRRMVTNLVLLNVGIYFLDDVLGGTLVDRMKLSPDLIQHPWRAWELLTYGFAHAETPMHVIGNMFFLWFFGREVETVYGKAEFLRLYLVMIVVSGLAWLGVQAATGAISGGLVGASGAVTGVMVVFVCHFPKRKIYIWAVLPVPAWVFVGFHLLNDLAGATRAGDFDNTAYEAHLAGAAFGFLYHQFHWNIGRMLPSLPTIKRFRRGPKLRVHDPGSREKKQEDQVDEILAKISREGEESLTKKERRVLEEASRRAQRRQES